MSRVLQVFRFFRGSQAELWGFVGLYRDSTDPFRGLLGVLAWQCCRPAFAEFSADCVPETLGFRVTREKKV